MTPSERARVGSVFGKVFGLHQTVGCMKKIQTRLTDVEYELLRRMAQAEGKTMQGWIREAIRARLRTDEVDPKDPLFSGFPLVRRQGPKADVAERHDEIVYGLVG
jgi:hypothetical protein